MEHRLALPLSCRRVRTPARPVPEGVDRATAAKWSDGRLTPEPADPCTLGGVHVQTIDLPDSHPGARRL